MTSHRTMGQALDRPRGFRDLFLAFFAFLCGQGLSRCIRPAVRRRFLNRDRAKSEGAGRAEGVLATEGRGQGFGKLGFAFQATARAGPSSQMYEPMEDSHGPSDRHLSCRLHLASEDDRAGSCRPVRSLSISNPRRSDCMGLAWPPVLNPCASSSAATCIDFEEVRAPATKHPTQRACAGAGGLSPASRFWRLRR